MKKMLATILAASACLVGAAAGTATYFPDSLHQADADGAQEVAAAAAPGNGSKSAPSNDVSPGALEADIDRLSHPRGKFVSVPIVQRVVSCGDRAVPLLSNGLTNGTEGHYLVACLCKIGTDASLDPIRHMLRDFSLDEQLLTNRLSRDHGISKRYEELATAIHEYPVSGETEILPPLIHYSDLPFAGVSWEATERLRAMIRRRPEVIGVIIASLDDSREQFSCNLGNILDMELGHPFRWPRSSLSDSPQNAAARYNSFWRGWWEQNRNINGSDRRLGR
jgi:hypothetical protein